MKSAALRASGELQQGTAQLSVNACLTACRPGIPCSACSNSCPERAIHVAERSVRIDPAACSGCGRCTTVCPTGAISAPGTRPASLFECGRVRRADAGAEIVPCLGGLSPFTLRDVLAAGDVTLIDRGWCKDCPVSGEDAAPWADTLNTVNAEAEVLGIAARVRIRREPLSRWRARPAPRGLSSNPARRALLTRLVQAGVRAAPVDPLSGLPDKVETPGPRRRAAQLATLARTLPLPGALFPALQATGQPRELNSLARLCPTSALTVTETGTETALVFDATACIACGDCTKTGVLALGPSADETFDCPHVVATRPVATCGRCRSRFSPVGSQAVCEGCARDTDLAAIAHRLMPRKRNKNHPI